jgi:hypothetical protein
MANLAFSDILLDVYAVCGFDSSDATLVTNVTRWANYVQQDLCARWPWSFMLGREAIATIPDYSTGTVAVSASGTTVTGTSTVFTTTHGDGSYYIQFSGANDWYRVSARASNTSLTIETAYLGTTNLTGSSYTLRKIFYSLSSTADRILDVRNWDTPLKMVQVDPRGLDGIRPNPQSSGPSYGYMTYGYDSSGNLQISPYPFPNDARLFEIRTHKRPTDGSISIPNKYAHIIAWGTNALGFAYKQDFEKAALWSQKFEQKINDMKKQDRQSEDYAPVLQSIDSNFTATRWQTLGDQYPIVTG